MAFPLSALRDHALFLSSLHERAVPTADITSADVNHLDFMDHSSLRPTVIAISTVSMVLITPIVFLRLIVRYLAIGRFFLDDYLVVLASIFTIVVCSVVLAATHFGLGRHVWDVNVDIILDDIKYCIQLMFVANIFHAAAIAFTKMSIIASYMNIFAPRGWFKLVLQITGLITIGLGIASIPATIFECIPVSGAWSVTNKKAKCYEFVDFLYASTSINIITDLALCVVPIPFLWKLQLPTRQKVLISGLFCLGGFACVAATVRLAYLHLLKKPIDITHDLVFSVIWAIAECAIGIVCVSLSHLRTLLAKLMPSIFRCPQISDKKSGTDAPAGAVSSVKTHLSRRFLKPTDVPDVPDYKSKLATQLSMAQGMGVSVLITAGRDDDDSRSMTAVDSEQNDSSTRPSSEETPVSRYTKR